MGRTAMHYVAVLTGLYLVLYYGTQAGSLVSAGASGASGFEKTLQGR